MYNESSKDTTLKLFLRKHIYILDSVNIDIVQI